MQMMQKLFRSARWDHTFNTSLATELLFVCFIILISLTWFWAINTSSNPLFASVESLEVIEPTQLSSVTSSFISFLTIFIVTNILYVVLLLGSFALSRAIVWAIMFKKHLTLKLYLRFVALKFFWILIWLPLIVLFFAPLFVLSSAVQVSPSLASTYQIFVYAAFALLLIMFYFGAFLNRAYFTHHRLYRAITDAFKHGVLDFPKIFLPLVISGVVMFLVYWLVKLLGVLGISYWITNLVITIYFFVIVKRFMIASIRDR